MAPEFGIYDIKLAVDRDRSVSVLYRFQRCHQLAEWSLRVLSMAQCQIMTWISSGRARNLDKVFGGIVETLGAVHTQVCPLGVVA